MYNEVEKGLAAVENGGTFESRRVLTLCVGKSTQLGFTLQALFQPVPNVEIVLEYLPGEDGGQWSTILSSLFIKRKPRLLLLCLHCENLPASEKIFEAVRQCQQDISVIPVLEQLAPDQLQRLVALGASDFCLAPVRLEDLLPRIMRWSAEIPKNKVLSQQLESSLGLRQLVGQSRSFVEAIHQIPKLARCDATVLITGETGTGKEMCARAIHELGLRGIHPFVPVNCGAIPLDLVENELFGHHAGAFTDASSAAPGLICEAKGGTLFLDEIDSLPVQTQVKLLRFLQDREYRPLGASKTCHADIRIIAASNADLEAAVRAGRFRADLFYRLNILPLKLPALRERWEDIPMLSRHFITKYAKEFSAPEKELSGTALEKLLAYAWPGNVRELENVIERAFLLTDQPLISSEDICLPVTPLPTAGMSFRAVKARAIEEFETAYVRRLLAASGGNISKAARAAKKNRRAFWQLMRKHGIVSPVAVISP